MADKDNEEHVGNGDDAHNNTKGKNKWEPVPKTTFKGETTSIKDYVFVYSQLHTKKWITSRQKFINYIGKTYGGNEKTSLQKRNVTIITMDEPIEPVESELTGLTKMKRELKMNHYLHDYKVYMDMHLKTTNNLTKIYEVLWGQCDPIMKNKIKADRRYTLADAKKSSIELLSIIETICEQGDITKNKRVQRLVAKKKVLAFRQHDEMDLGDYLEKFEILVSVAEKTGVKFYDADDIKDVIEEFDLLNGIDTDSFDEEEEDDNDEEGDEAGVLKKKTTAKAKAPTKWSELPKEDKDEVRRLARERALAIIFFANSNDNKYAIYKLKCRNAMTTGRDEYPTTVIEAHTALRHYA